MRPERRFERRNGKGGCDTAAAPKHTDSDPSEVNLLRAKIGLDKGVHFSIVAARVIDGLTLLQKIDGFVDPFRRLRLT